MRVDGFSKTGYPDMIVHRHRVVVVICFILACCTACQRFRVTNLETLRLEHHEALRAGEHELQRSYAAILQAYIESRDDGDTGEALIELIRVKGALCDHLGAQEAYETFAGTCPADPLLPAARLELARIMLAAAEADLAEEAVYATLDSAYGYAHETRLAQNLASLLALRGDLEGARGCYERIKVMNLYTEFPARFRSLQIFLDYLDEVGKEFPHFSGEAFGGNSLDTRVYKGRPLFIHFWRRRGSLNHDMEFLQNMRLNYPDLAVVSVNVGDPPEAVRQAVLKHAPAWPMYHDGDGSLAESLGITFMGLYVHEPKGILIDQQGRTALMPGREGAIAMGLRALCRGPEVSMSGRSISVRVRPGESAAGLKEVYTRAMLLVRQEKGEDYLKRLMGYLRKSPGAADAASTCIEIMKMATQVDDLEAARQAHETFMETHPKHPESKAVDFAYAHAMLTSGDAETSKHLVYEAIGDRREREDLYILLDLAAALSVLNDAEGARAAYEKVIEVTGVAGGAGERPWREYIRSLDRIGKELEHFRCEGLDGGSVDTRDYGGKLLLIDFWGSWCHACIREMPHVYESYNQYGNNGFEVLGVVVRDTRKKARAFLRRMGYMWGQAFDEGSEIANEHVVVGYPTTILIDREGKVRCTRTFGGGLEIALKLLIDR
jgi:thiol-disulfide isomerase/thioredoxin